MIRQMGLRVWSLLAPASIAVAVLLFLPSSADSSSYHWQAEDGYGYYLQSNHEHDGYLDFDGDGKTDIARHDPIPAGQGGPATLRFSSGGATTWVELPVPNFIRGNIAFGDFDGDGETDIFKSEWAWGQGADWRIWHGGTTFWQPAGLFDVLTVRLAFGDFDGDGKTDAFHADGSSWYVSYGARAPWTKVNTSGYGRDELAFGDFNGDGKTDVFRATGPLNLPYPFEDILGFWYVSYSGESKWTEINRSNADTGPNATMPLEGDLGFADFNGDGKTDVFRASNTTFYVSYSGTGRWTVISTQGEPHNLHFGDLDGNGYDDVFKPTVLTPGGWKVWYNYGTRMEVEYVYPTGPAPDYDPYPPVISDVTVTGLTPTSATIEWTTDEPATSVAEFGLTTTDRQRTVYESALKQKHVHQLIGRSSPATELEPDTLYYYRVLNWDEAGNIAWSSWYSLRTPPAQPTPPPPSDSTTTSTTTSSTTTTTAPPGTGTTTTTTPPLPTPDFPDVSPSHPYHDAIYGLAGRGVVSGYADDTFRPQNPVLRAQFAKMISGAMDLTVTEGTSYSFTDLGTDLADSLYPHEYVGAAAEKGIILGYSDGTFHPYVQVSRAQAITMAVRAAKNLKPGLLSPPPAGSVSSMGNFDPTHGPNFTWAQYNGLLDGLEGYGTSWDPWRQMSRGEVAQVLWNLTGLIEG